MKYTEFYKARIRELPEPDGRGEVRVKCVFHKDDSPSLNINLETGKWRCFAPQCAGSKGGGYKKFDALLNGETVGNIEAVGGDPIPTDEVEGFHRVLLQTTQKLAFLTKERGLTLETIKRFKLGYDSERIWIPIPNEKGEYVNVRKYLPGAADMKVIAYAQGYNRPRLFPVSSLASPWVLLVEGEMDAMIACQHGLPAMTVTGGAGTWLPEFNKALKGKRVVVCYDVDDAGGEGKARVTMQLLSCAAEVRDLRLPLTGTKGDKDITDYFVKRGKSREELDQLLSTAPLVEPKVAAEAPPPELNQIHLSEVGEDRLVGKRVSSKVLIAGKDLAPFQVPWRIAYQCQMGQKQCIACGIAKAGGQCEVQLPEWDQRLLKMVNVTSLTVEDIIADIADVPHPCRRFEHQVKEFANVEAVKAIPEIDFQSERSEYVIRQLFYLGHGLETNHTYDIKAVVMPDPKTQYATAIVYEAENSDDSIEKFEANADTFALLRLFKVDREG